MENNVKEAEGIWQFVRDEPVEDDHGKKMSDLFTFRYGDSAVTIRLMSLSPFFQSSSDGFYTLKCQWTGNTLQYLSPSGSWTELAEFGNGEFVKYGNGKKRIFKKISPDEVVEWNRAILKEGRELYNYKD